MWKTPKGDNVVLICHFSMLISAHCYIKTNRWTEMKYN